LKEPELVCPFFNPNILDYKFLEYELDR